MGRGLSIFAGLLGVLGVMLLAPPVFADRFTSTNYTIDASTVGNSLGGAQSSTNYNLVSSGGESVVGDGTSGSYKLGQGYVPQLEQSLQLTVQPDGLLAYYPLDEATGTRAYDASTASNHMDFSGTPTWGTGVLDGGITTSASNSLVMPSNPGTSYSAMSVCAWSKITTQSSNPGIVSHTDNTLSTSGMWSLGYGSTSSTPKTFFNLGGTVYQVTSSVSAGMGNWAHICMTYGGTDLVLYVDGVERGRQTVNVALTSPTAPFSIGARGTTLHMIGSVDEVKIFNRVLSGSEIRAEHNAQSKGIAGAVSLNTITPGTSQTSNFDTIVQTDAPGYNLAISQNHDLRNGGNGEPDFAQDFNAFGNGTTLTTGNTGFDNLFSSGTGTFTSSTSSPIHGTFGRFNTTTSSTDYASEQHASTTSRFYRFYMRLSSLPAATATIFSLLDPAGSTTVSALRMQTNGTILLRNGNITVNTSTTALSANEWMRVELFYNAANSTQTLKLYKGGNVDSTTPTETLTGAATNGAASYFQLGMITAQASQTYDLDEVETSTATWLGPSATATIPAVSSSIASPAAWSEGTTKGLGFSLSAAPGLDGKWGSGANYAAFPLSPTTFYTRSGYTGGIKDVIALRARLDVTTAQYTGDYENTVTITGTIIP